MPVPFTTTIAGERIELLPQRALYWTAQRMLIVADIHFGKAAAFRAKGIPVPEATTDANLDALDALLAERHIEHIVFLGDFLHSKAAHTSPGAVTLLAWRSRHAQLKLTLVRGNHDTHAGDPPSALDMHIVDEPHQVGPFAFCHHPDTATDAYVLAGHVHPVFRLSAGGDSLRLPCFLFGPRGGMLPSFGAFTGGYAIEHSPGARLFVTTGDQVFEVPYV
jgi:uncharacterized protein